MKAKWRWSVLAFAAVLCSCSREKVPEYSASGTVPYAPPEQIRQREPLPCDERAIVLVGSPGHFANGFVFGDGFRVATAHHVVRIASQRPGDNWMRFRPWVLSRYWGDIFQAKIVVADATPDIAILEVAWPGHPALELATREELAGVQDVVGGALIWPGREREPAIEAPRLATERFQARFDGTEQQRYRLTGRVEQMGRGWSGCPIALAESGTVAGVFHSLGPKRTAQATTAWKLQALAEALPARPTPKADPHPGLPRPADAEVAFAVAGRLVRALVDKNEEAAFSIAAEFVSLRPDSPMAHALFARAADDLGHETLADEHLAKARRLRSGNAAKGLPGFAVGTPTP